MQASLSLLSRCMDLPGRGSTARCFFAVFLSGRSGSNLRGATGVSAPSQRQSGLLLYRGSIVRRFGTMFLSGGSGSNLAGPTAVSAPPPRRTSVPGGSDSESRSSDDSFDNVNESERLTSQCMTLLHGLPQLDT